MATKRAYELSVLLWEALRAESVGAPGVLGVFEGSMTEVYRKTQISMTHYTRLFEVLKEMGCIVIERKGRRDITSRIVLLQSPTEELFKRHVHAVDNRLTETGSDAILALSQRVSNIEGRLQGVDIKDALLDIERRLQTLEGKGE